MAYYTTLLKKLASKRIEKAAGGAITPGHLVKLNSSDQLVVHDSAGGLLTPKMIAFEDELQGKTITDAYASGNQVQAEILDPGDEVYAIIATSQTISIGDRLESAGDGTLREYALASADDTSNIFGIAMEAVTTTSSTARCRVMVV